MQRMAELVEQCARVVEAEQLRRAGRAFREIHHIDDDGADVAGKFLLAAELRHPGAAALRGPREIIAKKQRDMFAPLVQRPRTRARPDDRDRARAARQNAARRAAQPRGRRPRSCCRAENRAQSPPDRDRNAACARALRNSASRRRRAGNSRPRFRSPPGARRAPSRLFERRRPHPVEKSAHGLGRFRHCVVELVSGEILIAEQPRAFVAQLEDFDDDGAIICISAVLAPARPGAEGRLAQIAPSRALQKDLDRGARERDAIFAAGAALGGKRGGRGAKTLRKPVERVFVEQQQERGFIGQHILRKSGAELGEPSRRSPSCARADRPRAARRRAQSLCG